MSKVARITNDNKLLLADELIEETHEGEMNEKIPNLSLDNAGNLTTDKIIEYPIELEGGRNLLKGSNKTVSPGGEFNRFADLAPLIDKYGYGDEVKYSISFDLKSEDTTNEDSILIYMQNGSGSKYDFFREDTGTSSLRVKATTEYQRFKLEGITFTLKDENEIAAYLAFFGVWDTGNIPTVKNVKVELGSTATPWTPAPEDLGLWYSDDIQYFNMGIKDNILMVSELIEDVALNIDYYNILEELVLEVLNPTSPEPYILVPEEFTWTKGPDHFSVIASIEEGKIVIDRPLALRNVDLIATKEIGNATIRRRFNITSASGGYRPIINHSSGVEYV